jgi:XTP/dITP diphosphohydrolase
MAIVEGLIMPTLLIATGNAGKVREMRAALREVGLPLLDLSDLSGSTPDEPEETGEGFLANAGIKALHYQAVTGLPALAEDSGLEVDALDGGPGVRSARWLGRDTPYVQKNRHLLELVTANPTRGRGARYRSAVAVAAGGRIVFRSTGTVEGTIAAAPRGSGGFGYDPVFFVPSYAKTMAELTLAEKERISHRGRALRPVRRFLRAALAAEPPILL